MDKIVLNIASNKLFISIFTFKAFSMSHVPIVELIKPKLLFFLFIDIIQYKKYKIIEISYFSFLAKFFGQKWACRSLSFGPII